MSDNLGKGPFYLFLFVVILIIGYLLVAGFLSVTTNALAPSEIKCAMIGAFVFTAIALWAFASGKND